jgi:type I restriction enzyme S subunit
MHQALSRNLERLRTLSIGTSTKYLTMGVLQNLPIAKPQYEEAEEIGERLKLIEKKRELAAKKTTTLESLFRTLLHQLMTANIRVRDLDLPQLESVTAA